MQKYDALMQAAKGNPITPELLAQVEAASQKADLDYLASEIPKAIQQSI